MSKKGYPGRRAAREQTILSSELQSKESVWPQVGKHVLSTTVRSRDLRNFTSTSCIGMVRGGGTCPTWDETINKVEFELPESMPQGISITANVTVLDANRFSKSFIGQGSIDVTQLLPNLKLGESERTRTKVREIRLVNRKGTAYRGILEYNSFITESGKLGKSMTVFDPHLTRATTIFSFDFLIESIFCRHTLQHFAFFVRKSW